MPKREWDAEGHLEEQYRSIFENAAVAVAVVDPDGYLVDTNGTNCRFLGYDRSELIGMHFTALTHPEDVDIDAAQYEALIRGETNAYQIEKRYIRKDGSVVWGYLSVSLIHHRRDRPPYTTAIAVDITERKHAEAERERLRTQLLQAQKMESVGRLAGGVAHDFHNMLGVILGYTELAIEQLEPDDPIYADLQEVQSAAERSTALTRQLLAFARKQNTRPQIIDINDTVRDSLKMLYRLIGEEIELKWLPAEDLPKAFIDPAQIDQILANLCVNAKDAIGDIGTITLKTAEISIDKQPAVSDPDRKPGSYVVLTVSDDGSGMDEETKGKIFEPFFTTKDVGHGTGLGLSTVFGIVKQNEGFVELDSEPGRGSSFSIYLPCRSEPEETGKRSEQKSDTDAGGSERILLVEDEPSILQLTKTILESKGYTVFEAQSPNDALHFVRKNDQKIDLLITDVVMPEMSGREMANRIESERPGIRLLFMSGYNTDMVAGRGVGGEETDFIQKPFKASDLTGKVRGILDRDVQRGLR